MILETQTKRGLGQSVDWKLIGCYLLLILIGWVNVYSASHAADGTSALDFATRSGKQLVWIVTAFGLAGLILFVIPARWWEGLAPWLYAGVAFLLVAVIFLGVEVKGSRSWFAFGPVRFQPAEVSKITTSLLLAVVMSQPNFKISQIKSFILTALVIALPMLIILGEKETGSALVYAGFIFVLYREGLSGWWLALIGLVILLFITTLTLSPYTSIVILIAVLCICNAFQRPKEFMPWILIGAGVVLVLSLIPWLWGLLTSHITAVNELRTNLVTVPEADAPTGLSKFSFLLKIEPLHILLVLALGAIPWFTIKSFRERNLFLGLSVATLVAGIVLVFSTDFIFQKVLQDHQRKRIEVLLGMKEDLSGVGYNVNQSMIAIGSGGMRGKGFLNGTQTAYGFVPEQSTDFIFCTVGEEWGFAGCLVVILLYVFLIVRLMLDADKCRESFTRIYGYCVAACVFMHLFINVGMTIGLMPVIGIPLPLLSYGGSSLWAFTVLIFIFIALYRQEKKYF